MDDIRVRPAVPQDVPGIRWLIQLLSEDMKELHGMKTTEEELLRDGFGDEKLFHCLVAELKSPPEPVTAPENGQDCEAGDCEELPSQRMTKNEQLVGYTLYYYAYSTWEGRVLDMEDVFVRKEYRNRGIGSYLMRECAKIAVSKQCARMQWQVLDWNTNAQRLYKRVGGKFIPEWLTMKMDRDTLAGFASGNTSTD